MLYNIYMTWPLSSCQQGAPTLSRANFESAFALPGAEALDREAALEAAEPEQADAPTSGGKTMCSRGSVRGRVHSQHMQLQTRPHYFALTTRDRSYIYICIRRRFGRVGRCGFVGRRARVPAGQMGMLGCPRWLLLLQPEGAHPYSVAQ